MQYVIGVGLDVTEQRRLEDHFRRTQKLETLATLVGGIAHDFNNQLTVVLGNLSLLLEELAQTTSGRTRPFGTPCKRYLRELAADGGAGRSALRGYYYSVIDL